MHGGGKHFQHSNIPLLAAVLAFLKNKTVANDFHSFEFVVPGEGRIVELLRDIGGGSLCGICMDSESDCQMLPCRCSDFCMACVAAVATLAAGPDESMQCPICRQVRLLFV